MILGVALAGKEGLETFKSFFRKIFRRKGPSRPVGGGRHRFGVLLFLLGNALLLAVAYLPAALDWQLAVRSRMILDLVGDVLIIVSFFVLGEQFWEKLKRLFTWEPA